MPEFESRPSDEDLLRAFQRGQETAFDELFKRYERRLVGYLANLTGDIQTARDVCQDTFLKLIRKPPLLLRPGTIKGWLFKVSRNHALDLRRRQRRHTLLPDPDFTAPSLEPNPAEQSRRADDLHQLRNELAALPLELRDIVCQRIYANLSFKEIARISGIPLGTALWRMHRALDDLRTRIRRTEHDC